MQTLLDGYRAFRDGHWPQVKRQYEAVAERQRPETLIVACSDSRVDPHTIFSAGPGELFIVRNVANIVPPFEQVGQGIRGTSAAIEFAVSNLKVSLILVLGHARCGGCAAALDHTIGADTIFLTPWIKLLDPAVERVAGMHDAQTALERESVLLSLERLRAFPFVADAMTQRGLQLAGARFGVADGRLEIYDETSKSFQDVT